MDVLVGTHRMLSKDVHFKNLGLLVVDEEQRFGVTHKERIKQLKTSVDDRCVSRFGDAGEGLQPVSAVHGHRRGGRLMAVEQGTLLRRSESA